MAEQAKLEILIKARDEASAALDEIGKRTENMSRQFKIAGAAMMAAGAAIVGALAMCVRAAAEEEAGMARLRVAAENVGIAYDEVEESLESWIDTMQQKTAIADSEQRDSLASLIRITRDVTEAQDLLVLSMDVAVGTGRDLASATTLIMYALSGNWGMLERYIPAIKEAADEEEKWMMLRELFAGQAEEFGRTLEGQYKLLMHNIGDLKEAIGDVLLPVVNKIVSAFNAFVQALKGLPSWLTTIGVFVVALEAGLAILAGTVLLLRGYLPLLAKGWHAIATAFHHATAAAAGLNIALAPLVGLLVLLTAGLVAIGVGVYFLVKAHRDAAAETKRLQEEMQHELESIVTTMLATQELTRTRYDEIRAMVDSYYASGMLTEALRDQMIAELDLAWAVDKAGGALLDQESVSKLVAEAKGNVALAAQRAGIEEDEFRRLMAGATEEEWEQLRATDALRGGIASLNEEYEKLTGEGITIPSVAASGAGPFWGGYQYGGVVPGPIGAPRLVVAHGGERIIPTNIGTYGGVTIHVASLQVREEADIDRIARKLFELQKRQQRSLGAV